MSKYWPKQSRADRIKEKTRLAIAHLGDEMVSLGATAFTVLGHTVIRSRDLTSDIDISTSSATSRWRDSDVEST